MPLAAAGLVGAVWLSLQFSPDAPVADRAGRAPAVETPGELPGFRTDAWYLPDDDLLGFVAVPAGPFLMGSDPSVDPLAFELEVWSPSTPQGRVEVEAYYIGRYEVTVAQYAAFVREQGHPVADPDALRGPPDHPVAAVSWADALAYARWLGARLLASPVAPEPLSALLRDGWMVTLPSEAEWEKAARGGDGRIYPWGDEPRADRANFRSRGTTRVGGFDCPECPFGLADMSGNVWELTRSPYQPYPYDGADDWSDLDVESLWVMRGGSFGESEQNVRAAIRGGVDPGARRGDIGFRLAITRF